MVAGTVCSPRSHRIVCVKAFGVPIAETMLNKVLRQADADLAEQVAASHAAEPLSVFSGRRGFIRQACGPGWALVGDAGHFKDPITAHGITDALRDAELLANAASAGALEQYQRHSRRPVAAACSRQPTRLPHSTGISISSRRCTRRSIRR